MWISNVVYEDSHEINRSEPSMSVEENVNLMRRWFKEGLE